LIHRAQFAAKNKPDIEFEKEVAQRKLESNPEEVTSESSVRPSYEGPQLRPEDPNTSEGVKKDVVRTGSKGIVASMRQLADMGFHFRTGL
jgi:hypothetical protein